MYGDEEESFDEEEVKWAQEALDTRTMTLDDIIRETNKPKEYWKAHLKRGRPTTRKPRKVDVEEVLRLLDQGVRAVEIARMLGVTAPRISQIKNRGY